ncbi:MAG TPA: hypothetical protein VKB38_02350 [Terracidiphilus sp.]|nr:hypothetical protein [Terracidiphilus sp.]
MRICTSVTLGVAAFLMVVPARAQIALIVDERPFHAHNLAGIVSDITGAALPGVRVDVCDWPYTPLHFESVREVIHGDCNSDPKHVLASTTTGAKGNFSFPKISMRRTRYLHLSLNGMDPMEVRVKWSPFARGQVAIKMVVAT